MKEIIINSPTYGTKIAQVDDKDYEYLNQWKWQLKKHRKTFYAHRTKQIPNRGRKKNHFKMHRVIMGVTDPKIQVDHIDQNGLNCRRSNLRIATHRQNKQNGTSRANSTSKYLGVSLSIQKYKSKTYKSWVMHITINGKISSAGFPFTNDGEIAAAKKYDELASKYFGEFANLNFKS